MTAPGPNNGETETSEREIDFPVIGGKGAIS